MGNIRNLQILKTFSSFFKLKASDSFGDIVGGVVVPVVNVPLAPALIQAKETSASDATTATIHTTSLTADTFIIGCRLTVAKDVNSISIFSRILFTPFNQTARHLIIARYEPTTVGSNIDAAMDFTFPIKVARGTDITISNSNGTASIDATGEIYFYEIED